MSHPSSTPHGFVAPQTITVLPSQKPPTPQDEFIQAVATLLSLSDLKGY
jgi:hypothetical protein